MTGYQLGSWGHRAGSHSLSLDWEVADALDSWEPSEDTVDAVCAAYRAAINAALPASVTLCGNEFYGEIEADDDTDLDIAALVASVDFWAIAQPILDAAPQPDEKVAQEGAERPK